MKTIWAGLISTVTDEAGLQKANTYDVFGRLANVKENPAAYDPNDPSKSPTTTYAYDAGDRLLTVTQGSGAAIQTRTFVYDALGRLRSATNPESGTINYTYDGNGNLVTRVSATGSVTMAYDHQNRVTSKVYGGTYGAVTPGVTYCYDGKVIAGSTGLCSGGGSALPFSQGRLSAVQSMVQSATGGSPVS